MKKINSKTSTLIVILMVNLVVLIGFMVGKVSLTFVLGIVLVTNIIRDIVTGDLIKIEKIDKL